MSILKEAAALEAENRTFGIITIIETRGSAPRHSARMLLLPDGSTSGTIGGGPLEHYAVKESLEVLKRGRSEILEYTLNSDAEKGLPMHCGGRVKLFVEVYTAMPEIYIIGGGHVGLALSRMAELLSYPYVIIDSRPDYGSKERYPSAKACYSGPSVEEAIRSSTPHGGSWMVVCTADEDEAALRETLKYETAYVGMIGSRRKIAHIFEMLKGEGVDEALLNTVHTPIGLSINAETPEEIAVSIMAEIISLSRPGRG